MGIMFNPFLNGCPQSHKQGEQHRAWVTNLSSYTYLPLFDVVIMEQDRGDLPVQCCANCGGVAEGSVSLKACNSCMLVKYCNVKCQKNHWSKHKKVCKQVP